MQLGDTAYIIYGSQRYRGTVQIIYWGGTDRAEDPVEVWVLIPELDSKRPYHRPFSEVYKTSREAKEALT